MKRIAILTSGGDAPGMNACIRAAVRTALAEDLEIYGIRWGYQGLIQGEISSLDRTMIRNIIHQGGTILGTARSEEFKTREGRANAIGNLRQHGIEGLILIGGDGTFRGGTLLAQESGIQVVGVPGTIDNDCYGTDYTIGFDTAINTALDAIDHIRDTARSHNRIFFVEVMGRHTGFIALESGIAAGAEKLIIPEMPISVDDLCQDLEAFLQTGKRSVIVVIAEAEQPGNSLRLAEAIEARKGFDLRVCILGHIQRGGSPTARDRILASLLGAMAVKALLQSKGGHMVGQIDKEIVLTPLGDTWEKRKMLHPGLLSLFEILSD